MFEAVIFDDGSGPVVIVGGEFETVDGIDVGYIAQWDGTRWSALGGGMDDVVRDLAVYDDGNGPALYASGSFTEAGGVSAEDIARWDGTSWSSLVDGDNGPLSVSDLEAFQQGPNPVLHVSGTIEIDGEIVPYATWDGSSWAASDIHIRQSVQFDAGDGMATYAIGVFNIGMESGRLAKWDGSWSLVTFDLTVGNQEVMTYGPTALAVYDSQLYMAGTFDLESFERLYLARWDGQTWSEDELDVRGVIYSMVVYDDDGLEGSLHIGGSFESIEGQFFNQIAKWDGSSWSHLDGGVAGGIRRLLIYGSDPGQTLVAVGDFTQAGNVSSSYMAAWDGAWQAVGDPSAGLGLTRRAMAFLAHDDGTGEALYVGGDFEEPGDLASSFVAKWTGTSWQDVGGGTDNAVQALASFDDGSGPALYAGGAFSRAGGINARRIAKWDGTAWTPLGSGIEGRVKALEVFDDGTGPALYAGGDFTAAGGVPASNIAKWDRTSWSSLAAGLSSSVFDMVVFDDGSGSALWVAGAYAGSNNGIRKWDGTSWTAPGVGINDVVQALAIFDDGNGPALYAGGNFDDVGGQPADHIARWDGTSWSMFEGPSVSVQALGVYDLGDGPGLYAAGPFLGTTGGTSLSHIGKWDGSEWHALGSGTNATSFEIMGYTINGERTLFMGGNFTIAGDRPSSHLGLYSCNALFLDGFESGDVSLWSSATGLQPPRNP